MNRHVVWVACAAVQVAAYGDIINDGCFDDWYVANVQEQGRSLLYWVHQFEQPLPSQIRAVSIWVHDMYPALAPDDHELVLEFYDEDRLEQRWPIPWPPTHIVHSPHIPDGHTGWVDFVFDPPELLDPDGHYALVVVDDAPRWGVLYGYLYGGALRCRILSADPVPYDRCRLRWFDFLEWRICFDGPGVVFDWLSCSIPHYDRDGDYDIDLQDFAELQNMFNPD